MKYVYDDGGRAAAGYKGDTGDCVCRAIAIARGKSYEEIYAGLISLGSTMKQTKRVRGSHPRTGVGRKVYEAYLKFYGWQWTPTMFIGSGCKVHLTEDELPKGRLIVTVSKHLTAVIDGVVHDTHDPQRNTLIVEGGVRRIAKRCVYGYYSRA